MAAKKRNSSDTLVVRGAREHNLKDVDLDLPRDSLVVFTGLSGSGKSSLAFDTIFAEGQRRYVESLSAYARQFLGQMDKPDVDFIEGLSPAVSIDQKSTSRNPRSTVGTITEIYDYLRLLFARIGKAHCPVCGEAIGSQSPQQITDQLAQLPERTRFQVLAPVVRQRKGEFLDLFDGLQKQGYARARVDGEVYALADVPKLKKQEKHDIEVVVDRISLKPEGMRRLTDSIETALGLADGVVEIEFVDKDENDPERTRRFSEKLACPNDHPIALDEIEPRTFSFNAPFGACPTCSGLGVRKEVDSELVIRDHEASIRDGALAPWSSVGMGDYFLYQIVSLGEAVGFSVDTPWEKLPKKAQDVVLFGYDEVLQVAYRNKRGQRRAYETRFEGVVPWVQRRHADTDSDWTREKYEQFMREIPCSTCRGARLKPEVLAVLVEGRSIADVCNLSIADAKEFFASIDLSERDVVIATPILKEVNERLRFLLDVGLDYLTLARAAGTLSGGEAQRIRLATQIGAGLVGVLYVLDEPSIGLHQRDNNRLIQTLSRLRDLGNTLIVVEHDEDTINTADWVVDVGPGAGEHGGQVVYSGDVKGLKENPGSLTGDYLSGRRRIEVPAIRRAPDTCRQLVIQGARENNLKNVTVPVPAGVLMAVTGVSGSGKSTLVNDILYNTLASEVNGAKLVAGKHRSISGLDNVDKVVGVDQSPIGRTPRSNPATYTGVFDKIRKLFAETPEAKVRGWGPGRFSFNVKGGRCETCSGDGTIKIEMNFLPDVYVPCETCHGARYNRDTLTVHYKGKTISEVLEMSIEEAAGFFEPIQSIHRHLKTLVEVGLGYVRLGQSAPTLSGGEAQRVKLASELQKRSTGNTVYILDEPTTGLHFEDVSKLLGVVQGLVDKGNTVITIEHNLDVIKSSDWIIDLGPEGGDKGGSLVAIGTPEEVAAVEESHTGRFLKPMLDHTATGKAAEAAAKRAEAGNNGRKHGK
ncbi:excinuclease ABC subunit UvrA [Salininema proteolyticum]|uniref:UvrABC system protein A n=1 Tax=Salininema proteolyticum TaxID=1607685 RepID=A0ABV8U0S3_9ACTN